MCSKHIGFFITTGLNNQKPPQISKGCKRSLVYEKLLQWHELTSNAHFSSKKDEINTLKPINAYVKIIRLKRCHSSHHADYADTRLFILPYSHPPPPPVLSVYPSLFSLPSFLLTERSACWLNLNYLLFFSPSFSPLTLSPFSSTEINSHSATADTASLHLFYTHRLCVQLFDSQCWEVWRPEPEFFRVEE